MGILNIRNLPDEVHRNLRLRAAKAGRSMEAEARAILTEVCGDAPTVTPESLQEFVLGFYGSNRPSHAVDDFIAERRQQAALE